MELTIVVGEKTRGRWRHKSIRYFKLTGMTLSQYQAATDRLMTVMGTLSQEFLDSGYDMYFRGKHITKDGE